MLERERITTIRDQMMTTTTMLCKKNVEEETTSKTKRSSDLISYLVRSNSIRVARKTPARHRSPHSL